MNENKKKIKIKFVDISMTSQEYDFFINILKKKYNVEISDTPDYVFFGTYGFNHLDYDCVRICYTSENFCPDFNIADYAIGYEILNFGDRYLRFPLYLIPPYSNNLFRAINRNSIDLNLKTEFCSFLVTNLYGANYRYNLFEKLNEYKKVNSGGTSLNNIGSPIPRGNDNGVESKYKFDLKHKFSIVVENASHPGYTTEKIVSAFGANCIPIYWGDPKIELEFNPNSFINCNDLTIDEAIKKIIKVDNDDEIYINMLNEKPFLGDYNKFYEDLSKFLYNIFDQPLEKAYRRDRDMNGRKQEHQYQLVNKFYYKPYQFFIKVFKFLHLELFGRKIYHLFRKD